jgi:ABC-type lipopolysaccharide export system ATPase subunit
VIGYLKKRGIGILITDHNVRETLDIIDRASIIHAGEVLFEGTPTRRSSTIRKCAGSIWATGTANHLRIPLLGELSRD